MSQLSIGFLDETEVISAFKLPYWSVKRFYGLFVANGLYFKSKSKRKREMRQAVSSLGVVYKEKIDTLDEISRLNEHVANASDDIDMSDVKVHLEKLTRHLGAIEALEVHLNRYGIATEHEVLVSN